MTHHVSRDLPALPTRDMPTRAVPTRNRPTRAGPAQELPAHALRTRARNLPAPAPAPTRELPARPVATPASAERRQVRALGRLREDAGAATAEYLVATMAAVGFAGLLIVILRGDEVRGILTQLVRTALSVG